MYVNTRSRRFQISRVCLKNFFYTVRNNYKYMPPWLAVGDVVVVRIIVACDLNLKLRETGFCSVVRLFVLPYRVAGSQSRWRGGRRFSAVRNR